MIEVSIRPVVTKFYSDLKSQLEVRKVRFSSGAKVTVFGQLGFDTRQMFRLSQYGVFLIRDRVSKGIGSNDQKMPPLKRGYAIHKGRNKWRSNIRDLNYTGEMLENISVRSVSATEGRIDITSQKQRVKARANEKRSPWWGWSPSDIVKLTLAARQLFKSNLSIGVGFNSRGRTFGSSSYWMNPNGWQKGGTVSGPYKRAA